MAFPTHPLTGPPKKPPAAPIDAAFAKPAHQPCSPDIMTAPAYAALDPTAPIIAPSLGREIFDLEWRVRLPALVSMYGSSKGQAC